MLGATSSLCDPGSVISPSLGLPLYEVRAGPLLHGVPPAVHRLTSRGVPAFRQLTAGNAGLELSVVSGLPQLGLGLWVKIIQHGV